MSKKMSLMISMAAILLMCSSLEASVIVNIDQVGSTVTMLYSGMFDLSTMTAVSTGSVGGGAPNVLIDVNTSTNLLTLHAGSYIGYSITSGAGPMGTGPFRVFSLNSGSFNTYTHGTPDGVAMALTNTEFDLSSSYVSNTPYSNSLVLNNTDYSYLGLNPGGGSYVYHMGPSETFTVNVSAVPEPSTYALLCISLGVVGFARKKMRKG